MWLLMEVLLCARMYIHRCNDSFASVMICVVSVTLP